MVVFHKLCRTIQNSVSISDGYISQSAHLRAFAHISFPVYVNNMVIPLQPHYCLHIFFTAKFGMILLPNSR